MNGPLEQLSRLLAGGSPGAVVENNRIGDHLYVPPVLDASPHIRGMISNDGVTNALIGTPTIDPLSLDVGFEVDVVALANALVNRSHQRRWACHPLGGHPSNGGGVPLRRLGFERDLRCEGLGGI